MVNALANFSNIIIPLLIFYIVLYGLVSGSHVYDDFTTIVLPMFEAMISNDIQNQQLAKLRDALLPKLMSGEMAVTDIH